MKRAARGINWRHVFRPGGLGHPRKGVRFGYAAVSSIRGLRWARKLKKAWVDRDLRTTKDGHVVVNHWSLLWKDGWLIGHNVRVEDLTLAELRKLVHPMGFKIHTLEEDIIECGKLGLKPIWEPKSNAAKFHDEEFWRYVVRFAITHGVKHFRGYALKANRRAVPAMLAAGIPAKVLSK